MCYIGNHYNKDIILCLSLGIKAIWLNRNNKEIDDKSIIEISNLSELFTIYKNNNEAILPDTKENYFRKTLLK